MFGIVDRKPIETQKKSVALIHDNVHHDENVEGCPNQIVRRSLSRKAADVTHNKKAILVLGLGNSLLSDDGAGPLAIARLEQSAIGRDARVQLRDGGTMGLNLLPDIEDCEAFIAIDAASFGAEPGTVRVFEGEAMDALLTGNKKTSHEVALADLLSAAALAGSRPHLRALVAVQPASIGLGLEPTLAVQRAMPRILDEAQALVARWLQAVSGAADDASPARMEAGTC